MPEPTRREFGVRAVYLKGRRPSRHLGKVGWILRWAEKVRDLGLMIHRAGTYDLIVVPGTGIFEDSMGLSSWDTPFDLFCLGVACRLRGTRLVYVCVGGGNPRTPLARVFFRTALSSATYRSFRDAMSRDRAVTWGVPAENDKVYPDIVFCLPSRMNAPPSRTEVAVGIMNYTGHKRGARAREQEADRYVGSQVALVERLLDSGRAVRLITGAPWDRPALGEVLRRLGPKAAHEALTVSTSSHLDTLIKELTASQLVISSRYHNLVAAAMAGRPTISLGYSAKHAELQRALGSGDCINDVANFEVSDIMDQVAMLESQLQDRHLRVVDAVRGFRAQLRIQEAELDALLRLRT
jgi:polysaccharide pyruvyl transferase WcaK-like protein